MPFFQGESMLDIKFIRENKNLVAQAIKNKHIDLDLDELLSLDEKLSSLKSELQELQTKRNAHSKLIPKASSDEERKQLIAEGKEIGETIKNFGPKIQEVEQSFHSQLLLVPNIPADDVPLGRDDNDNVEIKKVGETPEFSFQAWDHVEILAKQGWADFEKVAPVCGSRSYSLRNEMVLLELAVHRLGLDKLLAKGFTLAQLPALVREEPLVGTGHFPTGRDQVYHLPEDNLYLSGTAEVQLNSLHRGEILSHKDLPLCYAGYSPCFRREAGSYGRDVRGLIRVHQFMKVEQYIICQADQAEAQKWHETLLATSEELVQELELPYRVIECCTGDMGAGKVKMFDVECWVPSEEKYRETHSCSLLGDWQARRTDLRYRDNDGKVQHCFTLNNTAVATPRILVPLLENHQREDGRLYIPKSLRPYLGNQEFLGKVCR